MVNCFLEKLQEEVVCFNGFCCKHTYHTLVLHMHTHLTYTLHTTHTPHIHTAHTPHIHTTHTPHIHTTHTSHTHYTHIRSIIWLQKRRDELLDKMRGTSQRKEEQHEANIGRLRLDRVRVPRGDNVSGGVGTRGDNVSGGLGTRGTM